MAKNEENESIMRYGRFAGNALAVLMAVVLVLAGLVPVLAEEGTAEVLTADGQAAETLAATDAEGQSPDETPVEWPGFWDGVSADTACLIDANTGIVLYDKGMEQKMYPASVTKIMTTLLALENGNLQDQVAMTAEGTQYAVSGSSNLYTQVGEVFTLEQLLYGTMLKSANDMATQVGYHIGGNSLDNFFQMMNDRAASLGARNTHFHSACGMPDEEHWTCAYDLALIMAEAIRHPEFRTICQAREYAIPPTNLNSETRMFASHNLLLVDENYAYPGLIGGKTGYTDAAQNTLVESASRDGLDLVAVVLHEPDSVTAANDTIRMMDFGFANYQSVEVGKPEYTISGGRALLPKGVSADRLVLNEGEPYETEDGKFVRWEYLLDGRTVGFVVMSAENAEAYHVELFGPTATPSPEPTSAEAEKEAESSAANVTVAPKTDPSKKDEKGGSITGILFIVLVIIAILAAIGVIVFAILLHRAKVEAEKAKRRKQELRRRALADEKAREARASGADNSGKGGRSREGASDVRGQKRSAKEPTYGAGPSPAVKDAAQKYIERQEARRRSQDEERKN